MSNLQVPFFRPVLRDQEVDEVVATLRSGWLTSGPKVKRFEEEFAAAISAGSGKGKGERAKGKAGSGKGKGERAKGKEKQVHAVAVNSGTAALHLAIEALGLKAGQGVLVPTMTFAATAEVVRYQGAIPILVDCDPVTLNMDLEDAKSRVQRAKSKGQRGKGKGEGG